MRDPEAGHLVKSPKTFLGSDLRSEQLNFFRDVSASILGFMKNKAEAQLQTSIDKVVLGRPVHFHGTKGAASDRAGFYPLPAVLTWTSIYRVHLRRKSA